MKSRGHGPTSTLISLLGCPARHPFRKTHKRRVVSSQVGFDVFEPTGAEAVGATKSRGLERDGGERSRRRPSPTPHAASGARARPPLRAGRRGAEARGAATAAPAVTTPATNNNLTGLFPEAHFCG